MKTISRLSVMCNRPTMENYVYRLENDERWLKKYADDPVKVEMLKKNIERTKSYIIEEARRLYGNKH